MDENTFFRQATLRICGSLSLEAAMQRTLPFLREYIPADGLLIALYEPDLHMGRSIASIVPDDWPKHPDKIVLPPEMSERFQEEWDAEPQLGITNDLSLEDSDLAEGLRLIWPEDCSLAYTAIYLDNLKLGVLFLAAKGKRRFEEDHARLLRLLNEPFAIAVSNHLQFQETNRLKEILAEDNRYLQRQLRKASGEAIIGAAAGLKTVMDMVRQVAPLHSPVLLLGETGVGKEVVANAIHEASSRRDEPFVKVNCGGLPEGLLDSELFGHEKGAFTGANTTKKGRFERADGGTIFLDEVGELPPAAQVKLLRVLQYGEVERVGGSEVIKVDVRVVSATHRNLAEMIEKGEFREDLWFRLNVFPIIIPPLRQRPQDIPALVDHFIAVKSREMKIGELLKPAPDSLRALIEHPWPGNVRELQNLVERVLIQQRGSQAASLDFSAYLAAPETGESPAPGGDAVMPLDTVIADHIRRALEMVGGRVEGPNGAAGLLNLNPSTLRGKMRKLGIKAVRKAKE